MSLNLNNPTQILVLALVRCGLGTPYDLKLLAGMSVGQTGPVLKLLEKARLLAAEPGSRSSLRYSITELGEAALSAALESGKDERWWVGKFGFFESIPRAVLLAWLCSQLRDFPEWLGYAAEELRIEARRTEQEVEELYIRMERLRRNPTPSGESIIVGTTYRWIKATAEAALLKVQAELVEELTPKLVNLPLAPQFGPED